MKNTEQEIEEFRKYLQNPDNVKFDIIRTDRLLRQKFADNLRNGHCNRGFNNPDAFSPDDICSDKLIPTHYCWDADTKHIVGYPNRFLYSYPITYKNPRFITFLDINPNDDEDFDKDIDLCYYDLTDEDAYSSSVSFIAANVLEYANLDDAVKNVIIPGFIATLSNTEDIINDGGMSIPDLFVNHNYTLKELFENKYKKSEINEFLDDMFCMPINSIDSLNDYLCYNALVFNENDFKFIKSLINDNLNKINNFDLLVTSSIELCNIFTDRYSKTKYAYTKKEQAEIKKWVNNLVTENAQ